MNASGIVATLIADNSTANGLIGGRVYPGVAKQETSYPCVVVNLISPGPTNTKTEASDLDIASVQVDVYGSTYSSTATASAAIRTALDYYAGALTLDNSGGTANIASITYTSEQDGFVERPDIFRRMCEYTISLRR
ncbi:MAG: DUF3168 domain-containing protein [Candidatus Obscuribacter sp.]|nr:DUF3168 domain-containing protein [Candidatus Obscuribacter sp.]